MAVELRRDWPVIAGVVAAGVGIVLMLRREEVPRVVGGGVPPGTAEAIQAQTTLGVARLQTQLGVAQAYYETEQRRLEAQTARAIARTQAQAYLQAIQMQEATKQQEQTMGLLSTIVSGLFGLFSWEMTALGEQRRAIQRRQFALAYR